MQVNVAKLWNKVSPVVSESIFELLVNEPLVRKRTPSENLKKPLSLHTSAHMLLTCPGEAQSRAWMLGTREPVRKLQENTTK